MTDAPTKAMACASVRARTRAPGDHAPERHQQDVVRGDPPLVPQVGSPSPPTALRRRRTRSGPCGADRSCAVDCEMITDSSIPPSNARVRPPEHLVGGAVQHLDLHRHHRAARASSRLVRQRDETAHGLELRARSASMAPLSPWNVIRRCMPRHPQVISRGPITSSGKPAPGSAAGRTPPSPGPRPPASRARRSFPGAGRASTNPAPTSTSARHTRGGHRQASGDRVCSCSGSARIWSEGRGSSSRAAAGRRSRAGSARGRADRAGAGRRSGCGGRHVRSPSGQRRLQIEDRERRCPLEDREIPEQRRRLDVLEVLVLDGQSRTAPAASRSRARR